MLAATLVARAEHTEMVRPAAVPVLPPIPALEGPLGTAYRHTRSKGFIRINDACMHTIAFRQLEGIGVTDRVAGTGDEIICHTHLWIDEGGVPSFGTLVRRAEVTMPGRVRDTARLDRQTDLCREGGGAMWYELRGTRCYEADPSYAPSITIPFADDPTQGFVVGAYAPRPASRLIAVEGNSRQADLRQ
jgi:hypothetical protein